MYLCCDRNNNILGKVRTEKEAQELCNNLASSYIKIIPLLFWFMRNSNKFYTFNTTKGFLTLKEIVSQVKSKYNDIKEIGIEELISIFEEFFGDCTTPVLKKLQGTI